MLRIISLGSGSKGNCILIDSGSTKLLVDAGLSNKRIRDGLKTVGVNQDEISGLLITHCHSDHIKGAACLLEKIEMPVFAPRSALLAIRRSSDCEVRGVEIRGNDFFVGDITVSPFEVSHDVHCFGYSFYSAGRKVSVVTDLGRIDQRVLEAIRGSNMVMIEANHDAAMLMNNSAYPHYLKRRILSDRGHLSNQQSADACADLVENGASELILAHLSEQNNSAEMAYNAVRSALRARGLDDGRDCKVCVALQNAVQAG